MIKRSFINSLPIQLKSIILNENSSNENNLIDDELDNNLNNSNNIIHNLDNDDYNSDNQSINSTLSQSDSPSIFSFDSSILDNSNNNLNHFLLDSKAKQFLVNKLLEQKGIIFTEFNDIQLKLFDVDSTLSPEEFDKLISKLDPSSRILLCEKIKLIYGFNSLTSFIIRLINILNFSTFFSIFDITSNIKLYGFYSLTYMNPVEILVKQIRNDLFIVKSFKEFTIQEMKKEHDFHLPYKEFKRLNLNDGNLVVVKILFKNEQKPIDLSLIKPLLPKIKMLHLSLENESKLKPFNDLIDKYGIVLNYLKFGVNRGTFKKIPTKNNIDIMKLVNIDNLNFINDLKDCNSLDVFFDNWELRKNCDIKFQENFIIKFEIMQRIENLKILNIFHTYIDSKDLNKLKFFPNLTHSKISYVILDNDGFDMSECKNLQELKIHFTYQKLIEDIPSNDNDNDDVNLIDYSKNIHWPCNLKKLSITIHNIKNLIQNFSIRLNILKKIAKPLPPSIIDLCIDISYDTGGSGPELYSISRDDILKISSLINKILTNNLENLKLKGISRYNYKIGKPLIFSAINFPNSLKLLSLNDFILDYNFINLPNLKKLYFEHSLFDSDFKLPISDEILIEKCTFKDLSFIPSSSNKIEFKMCTFRKVPSYNGDISNIIINNCRVMEQPTNNIFQFQQQLQMKNNPTGGSINSNHSLSNQRKLNSTSSTPIKGQQRNNIKSQYQLNNQLDSKTFTFDGSNYNFSNNTSPQNPPQRSQTLPFNSLPSSNNSLSMINEFSNNLYQNSGNPQYAFSNFSNQQQQQQQQQQSQSQPQSQQSFSMPRHQSFDYNTPNLNRSSSDVVNLLNKDLDFQFGNLSLNSSQYLNGFSTNSTGNHTPLSTANNNNNNTGIPSPQPLNLSINSPPISSTDSINSTNPINHMQKRSNSYQHSLQHSLQQNQTAIPSSSSQQSNFNMLNPFNKSMMSPSFNVDNLDQDLTRSSLGNLYDSNNQKSPIISGNPMISSSSAHNYGYYNQGLNGNVSMINNHNQQLDMDSQQQQQQPSFMMSPSSSNMSESRMSISGGSTSMLMSQHRQPTQQHQQQHQQQQFLNSSSSRPSSQYFTNHNLINPVLGAMNSGGNANNSISSLGVFGGLPLNSSPSQRSSFMDLEDVNNLHNLSNNNNDNNKNNNNNNSNNIN
ncbi:hypothetical protein C6P40_004040 [Pichia californica]|uniref:Uncharacterized protein n=1 Tax=Pichia californica TaxID=460514 RepID=A0A9P6WRH4_9ASCO|nr:hypothetical protein C6P42_002192 [[Candida] californica]KAG0691228.1 hypothetical protein C6P40_004040 [[Candida] californica]